MPANPARYAGSILPSLVILLLAATSAAARRPASPPPLPVPEAGAVAETLSLIGDAGEPAEGGEPVLVAWRRQVERAPSRKAVALLGDTVYPDGLPAPDDPEYAEMLRRLDDQVDAVKDTVGTGEGERRIDLLRDGGRRLGVIEVAKDGSAREAFAKMLDRRRARSGGAR